MKRRTDDSGGEDPEPFDFHHPSLGKALTGVGVGNENGCARAVTPILTFPHQGGRDFERTEGEDPEYLTRQLITYIGNKRALLGQIGDAVERVKERLGKRRLRVLDAFSGSGVVSRLFKAHAELVVSNDIEPYAAAVSRCFLSNRSEVDLRSLAEVVAELNERVEDAPYPRGFIEELYAPEDESRITRADRVFYTKENARRLDNYRRMMDELSPRTREMLMGPLLSEASVHANTAGVFKGFYKDRRTKVGRFGGSGSDALSRIRGRIVLSAPALSRFECEYEVTQEDANALAPRLWGLDLAYLDPPYNQHPYGSNYFMLNLLLRYERPGSISRVSGIPRDWQRSGYNVRAKALPLFERLVESLDAAFVLVSFNDEGFIPAETMLATLEKFGAVETFSTRYNAFRGSRSFRNRSVHVNEYLFLVDKRG